MKSLSGREFAKVLAKHGWTLLHIQGSHHIYGKSGERARISVPVHGNKPLTIGLLGKFMKVAGLQESDLE
jgi:predicted RNA binding protein YcfA (HicA-like mRNA interferase family)